MAENIQKSYVFHCVTLFYSFALPNRFLSVIHIDYITATEMKLYHINVTLRHISVLLLF
jgi:hypothetical protein